MTTTHEPVHRDHHPPQPTPRPHADHPHPHPASTSDHQVQHPTVPARGRIRSTQTSEATSGRTHGFDNPSTHPGALEPRRWPTLRTRLPNTPADLFSHNSLRVTHQAPADISAHHQHPHSPNADAVPSAEAARAARKGPRAADIVGANPPGPAPSTSVVPNGVR
jgi:hypothetical protein